MSVSTQLFLGDLVRALQLAGKGDGQNWSAITAMLGFREAEASTPEDLEHGERDQPLRREPFEHGETGGSVTAMAAAATDSDQIGELIEFDLERSTASAESIVLDAVGPFQHRFPNLLQLRPLFDASWERGILIEAAGMARSEGSLAVLRAVELIARGDALRDLPLEKIQSVSKGCQILLDTGVGMQPFARDGRQLVQSLRRAVGAEHTRVLTFVDCPTNGVMTETYRDESYVPPENGAIVLAVSDLCGGGPRSAIREADPEEWLMTAKRIHDAGSSLVVVNPYPPARWPAAIAQQVPIVHWDTVTKVANVRQARRRLRR